MRETENATDAFLLGTPWAAWRKHPVAGDASARRYVRLVDPGTGQTAILMIAPPNSCGPMAPFLQIAQYLSDAGHPAPRIFKAEAASGFAVIEDLGETDVASWLASHPGDEAQLYDHAATSLIRLDATLPPKGLAQMTPEVGAEMLAPFFEEFALDGAPSARSHIERAMRDALERLAPFGTSFALRDFHAENLIWRPDKPSDLRLGLLDFQDAFIAPRGYDLVSLIRDARRDVGQDVAAQVTARFCAATGMTGPNMALAIATLGVQRNLRILGIFSRLARLRGKPAYLALQPRVAEHVRQDLKHPELTGLHSMLTPLLEGVA